VVSAQVWPKPAVGVVAELAELVVAPAPHAARRGKRAGVVASRRDFVYAGQFDHRMGRQARQPSREAERENTSQAPQAGDQTVRHEKINAG
jgi:hypothetical protein